MNKQRTQRLVATAPLAGIATLFLITLMIVLIGREQPLPERKKPTTLPHITFTEPELVEPQLIVKPVPPVRDQLPPPQVPRQSFDALDGSLSVVTLQPAVVKVANDLQLSDGLPKSAGMMPIFCVAPVYPDIALRRGLEGDVVLEFVVNANGAVQHPAVISSTSSLFERAALEAVKKCKYNPHIENGVAMPVGGVKRVFRFRLDE